MAHQCDDNIYEAPIGLVQEAVSEDVYEDTGFSRNVTVSQALPSTNPEKPRRKLTKIQIAFICALILNFATAICGILFVFQEKARNAEHAAKTSILISETHEQQMNQQQQLEQQQQGLQEQNNQLELQKGRINEEMRKINEELKNKTAAIGTADNAIPQLSVRLAGGSSSYGRVEVFYKGVWGTVCDDGWGITDANVVCRMLGFQQATAAKVSAYYGEGTGEIWLDDVQCKGNEAAIWQCGSPWGEHDCTHDEDAGVVCE